jgi:opine dehydrogenase
MKTLPRVAVCGAGRAGLSMAADLALMGCEVNLFQIAEFEETLTPIRNRRGIEITGETQSGKTGLATVSLATTDPKEAIRGVDLIIVAAPAFGHKVFFDQFSPYLEEGQNILVSTSYWACLRFAPKLREMGILDKITLAEASIMPYACTLIEPGVVHIYRTKQKDVKIAAFPAKKTEKIFDVVKTVYPQHEKAPSVLWTSLGCLNTPVHAPFTIPMAGLMFDRYPGGCKFYGEATTPGARLIEAYDKERLAIAKQLGVEIESEAKAMFTLYGYKGKDLADAMRKSEHADMFCDIVFMKGLLEEDLRYFYVSLSQLGDLLGIPTPVTKGIIGILSVMLDVDYWQGATTLENLGLAGLNKEQIVKYATEGKV